MGARIEGMSDAEQILELQREFQELSAELIRRHERTKLERYEPYPKQREFHRVGKKYRERLLMAGNQLGKTFAGAAEAAFHLTGHYPEWWEGLRFDSPVRMWCGSETAGVTRDGQQRLLIGEPGDAEQIGTGMIPGDLVLSTATKPNVPGALEKVTVKHVSGGVSTLGFKSYDQGREKWQGETLDVIWFDEEPPESIYTEGLTRTNATGGKVYMTFTPLKGMSRVVRRFLRENSPSRTVVTFTIHDVEHLTEAQKDEIIAAYPEHEREARTLGIPVLGEGAIYPVSQSEIQVDDFEIPAHWPQIGGLDFGWDHPFAATKLAYNLDTDVIYVCREYRQRKHTPAEHVLALKKWGESLPWAWPHDGMNAEKGSGKPLAEHYRDAGLNMLADRATHEDGSNSVEAGIFEILSRMRTGRFKIFKSCHQWFAEYRDYHRREGKIYKEEDDLMDATRYGVMMLRFAQTDTGSRESRRAKYMKQQPSTEWVV